MLKRSALIYGVVAAVVISFSATHASFALAAGQPVVSFRLAQPNAKNDGLLLTGGLSNVASYDGDDSLRGQALSGQ